MLSLLLVLSLQSGVALAQDDRQRENGRSILAELNRGFTSVFEAVAPSVVVIKISKDAPSSARRELLERFGFDFFLREPGERGEDGGERQPPRGLRLPPVPQSEGSGFLTNYHVIQDASEISVMLKDGREFKAEVVGRDDKTDLAVIKIDADNITPARLGDSDAVQVGELACVIGAPYNLDYSFTVGVVSAIGRSNLFQAAYEEYIQTDASINPGNSGGPLVDIEGRVIGINTLINGINRGLGFAIPINMAKNVAGQLVEQGRVIRPWLGIRIQTLSEHPGLKDHLEGIDEGVIVETIEPDTPAYRSELQPADIVTEVDGVAVRTARDLQKEVLAKNIGEEIVLTVWRAGEFRKVGVVTEQLPDAGEPLAAANPSGGGGEMDSSKAYGLQLQNLTPELAKRMELAVEEGVLVTEIEADSPADIAGILPRDVITEVDSRPVANIAELNEVIARADPSRGILFFLDRGGEKTYAVLKSN